MCLKKSPVVTNRGVLYGLGFSNFNLLVLKETGESPGVLDRIINFLAR